MNFPISTLQAARLLKVPDHRLTGLVRLEKVLPPLVLGRRAWGPDEVLAAARLVGRDSPELRRILNNTENTAPVARVSA